MESDSQGNQWNQTKVLPAITIEVKSSFIETNDSSCFIMCLLSDCVIAFWTSPSVPRLHVKTSISLAWVGEVPHLPGTPHFHVKGNLSVLATTWTAA